jgi:hypothetical protein
VALSAAKATAVEGQFGYEDFDLLIDRHGPDGYRARVLRSPAGECAAVEFILPFAPLEVENFLLKLGRGGRGKRGGGRPESGPLKEFGAKLYGAVFKDELREILQRSLSSTYEQNVGLRLRLRLSDTPELAELPWEFLYDTGHKRFLARSRYSPLVRYLDLPDPPHSLSVDGPLRVMVMISNPSDYYELDAEREWNLLNSALAQQLADGRVVIERLAASMSALRGRLRLEEFHVFHFVGHGLYRSDWGSGVLVMEGADGRSHEVTGDELGVLLSDHRQTRLAVLNACEGARSDGNDLFGGTAQSLIQQGLPAVVAMQFQISDAAAIIFAREFYGAIADGYRLEAAVAEARGAISDEGHVTEWGTPVLYSRAPDGRLFDVTGPVRVEAERPAQEDAAPEVVEEAEEDVLRADEEDVPEADEDDEFEPWEEEVRPARGDAAGEAWEAIRLQAAAQDLLATIEKVQAGLDSAGMDDTSGVELAAPPHLGPADRDAEPSPPFQRGERVQLGSIFGDSPRPPRWTVDLVKSSTYGRTLAIRLSHETHILEIRIRKFRDSILVDGKPVTRSSAIAHKNKAFSMSDGPQLRTAGVWVETDKANHITDMKLTLDGQIFYYE